MKWHHLPLSIVAIFVVLLAALIACGSDGYPAPDSDSSLSYKSGSKIPVDDSVYTIVGQVAGDVSSITRQSSEGYVSGSTYSSGYGSVSGSFFSETTGKGFVRLFVHSSAPATNLAPPESLIVVKTTDSKVTALYPGDIVTLVCRRQYEAIAAVRDRETFDSDKAETWELDYCRLKSPVIQTRSEQ